MATLEAALGKQPVVFLTADQVRDSFLEPFAAEVDRTTFFEVLTTLRDVLDPALHGFAR